MATTGIDSAADLVHLTHELSALRCELAALGSLRMAALHAPFTGASLEDLQFACTRLRDRRARLGTPPYISVDAVAPRLAVSCGQARSDAA
jgi:hypothetical protein